MARVVVLGSNGTVFFFSFWRRGRHVGGKGGGYGGGGVGAGGYRWRGRNGGGGGDQTKQEGGPPNADPGRVGGLNLVDESKMRSPSRTYTKPRELIW